MNDSDPVGLWAFKYFFMKFEDEKTSFFGLVLLLPLFMNVNTSTLYTWYCFVQVKVVIHVEMPKAAPKSPFVIFKN